MSLMSKEYVESHFKRATWWDFHPDKCPNDFGPPENLSPRNGFESKEEEEAFYEAHLQEEIAY